MLKVTYAIVALDFRARRLPDSFDDSLPFEIHPAGILRARFSPRERFLRRGMDRKRCGWFQYGRRRRVKCICASRFKDVAAFQRFHKVTLAKL